ncbi:chromosome partitioning protein ParB [Shewanella algae]|uniref:chromosome partitioning protein ParB n=1 Tax=Shewanella algae TaxID=38313 RepID=UPI0030076EEB
MNEKKSPTLSAGRPSAGKSKTTLASLADKTATKRVNFDVTAEEHTKLKIYAARQGKTVKELLTEYVRSLPDD